MRLTPGADTEPPAFGRFQRRIPAAARTTTAAAAIARVFPRFFCGMAYEPLVTAAVDELDASDSAYATSFADWKRLSRSFSRQCRTRWSSATGMARPDCEISAGSSRMIDAIVSPGVS